MSLESLGMSAIAIVWLWVSDLTSQYLSFLIYEIEIILASTTRS